MRRHELGEPHPEPPLVPRLLDVFGYVHQPAQLPSRGEDHQPVHALRGGRLAPDKVARILACP